MPWKRRGGRSYFYESRREGRKVRSVYVGAGPLAELVTRPLAIRRESRESDRELAVEFCRVYLAQEAAFEGLFDLSRELAEWALRAAGFHRPNRGPWRRRRRPMNEPLSTPPPPPVEPLELRRTMERVMLDRVIASGTGTDEGGKRLAETFKADLLAFAGELAGPRPSPIVRALAFSAAVAYFDWVFAGFHTRGNDRRDRALDRAERRFQRALKTLHAVKDRVPQSITAVQINVDARKPGGGVGCGD